MPIEVRIEPVHLVAPAGADVDGTVVLVNPGLDAVHVRLVISSEVAGWASFEPGDLWVPARGETASELRFRLPRGAPGGVGAVPFVVRVLSDHEGEGGATAEGTLDVVGEAELALRLLPSTVRGVLSATAKVAVDNLGGVPARAQLLVETPDALTIEADPDSLIIEPNSTEFARVHVRPTRRLFAGKPRHHEFWVRVDPLGGARISASGTMVQRSLVAGFLPRVLAGLVALALVAFGLSRVIGSDDGTLVGSTALTTLPTTTTTTSTTAPPETTAPPAPGVAPTTIPLKDRRIAFQTNRDGNSEIYSAAPDGKDPKNLTSNPAHDSEAAWSPDHTKIAFDSDRAGGFDVFVMNADGTGVVQLTTEPAPDGYPTWSPDGTRLAFISFRDGNSEIYVMSTDGTNVQRLTKNVSDDARPVWSPDGTRIAFHTDRDGNYEVYVMKADGTEQKNLSNTPSADQNPSWAPNSARLAFDSTRDGSKSELYVMGADGSLPTRLTTNDDTDKWPVWSPDGARLAFQTDQDSDVEIYVIASGGGAPKRLTESPGDDAEPSWS
jgi:Tol biopolymer transport system component